MTPELRLIGKPKKSTLVSNECHFKPSFDEEYLRLGLP